MTFSTSRLAEGLVSCSQLPTTGFCAAIDETLFLSYPVLWSSRGHGSSLTAEKRQGCEVEHSPPSRAVIKNECSYTSSSCAYLLAVDMENVTHTFINII